MGFKATPSPLHIIWLIQIYGDDLLQIIWFSIVIHFWVVLIKSQARQERESVWDYHGTVLTTGISTSWPTSASLAAQQPIANMHECVHKPEIHVSAVLSQCYRRRDISNQIYLIPQGYLSTPSPCLNINILWGGITTCKVLRINNIPVHWFLLFPFM